MFIRECVVGSWTLREIYAVLFCCYFHFRFWTLYAAVVVRTTCNHSTSHAPAIYFVDHGKLYWHHGLVGSPRRVEMLLFCRASQPAIQPPPAFWVSNPPEKEAYNTWVRNIECYTSNVTIILKLLCRSFVHKNICIVFFV